MVNKECLECKKYMMQPEGKCHGKQNPCIHFERDPRGKMVRTKVRVPLSSNSHTKMIKPGELMVLSDKGKSLECIVRHINDVNLDNMTVSVEIDYHEKEMPVFEKKKLFRILK